MRAILFTAMLTGLSIISIAGPTRTCLAQSESKAPAPQALTGPGGSADSVKTPDLTRGAAKPAAAKSNSSKDTAIQAADRPKDASTDAAPKVRAANSTREESGRVGTLSPDEKRRAARARARAEAEAHPPLSTPVKTSPDTDAAKPSTGPKTEPAPPLTRADRAATVDHRPGPQVIKVPEPVPAAAPVVAPSESKTLRTASRGADLRRTHVQVRSASRRTRIAVAGRAPRVGDVVPPDVRLMPLPEGRIYPGPRGYGDFAMDARREPWRYPPPPPAYLPPPYPYPRPFAAW